MDRAKRSNELKRIVKFAKAFCCDEKNKSLEISELVQDFLEQTDDSQIPTPEKLIILAHVAARSSHWARVCQIYRHMEADFDEGIYITWLTLACDFLTSTPISNPEKIKIAVDAQSIIFSASSMFPKSSALNFFQGQLYLHHPSLPTNENFYFKRALKWFRAAQKINCQNDYSDIKTDWQVADCLFNLKRWRPAKRCYKRFLSNSTSEIKQLKDFILERVVKCEQDLVN